MTPRYGVQWGGEIPCTAYSNGGLFNGYYENHRLVWNSEADAKAYRDSRAASTVEEGGEDDYEVVTL